MSRYRVAVCRDKVCPISRLHFNVEVGGEVVSTWWTRGEAMDAVALIEARRLAGDEWTLRTNGPVMEALRVGALHPARFRSWAQVAEFLAGVREREARFPAGVGA